MSWWYLALASSDREKQPNQQHTFSLAAAVVCDSSPSLIRVIIVLCELLTPCDSSNSSSSIISRFHCRETVYFQVLAGISPTAALFCCCHGNIGDYNQLTNQLCGHCCQCVVLVTDGQTHVGLLMSLLKKIF